MITIPYVKCNRNIAEYYRRVDTVYSWLYDNIGPPGHGWYISGSSVVIDQEFATQATAFKLLYGI